MVADEAIQGSGEIIEWTDERGESHPLTPDGDNGAHLALEKRLNDVAGVHIRRFFYSYTLFNESNRLRDMFANDVSSIRGLILKGAWPMVRNIMIKQMDLGPEQGVESKGIVDAELDWMEGLLSDGRKYLVGDKFSRADLTAASLLAPLVKPDEHPIYPTLDLPERMADYIDEIKDRPSINWVREIYKQHRRIKN